MPLMVGLITGLFLIATDTMASPPPRVESARSSTAVLPVSLIDTLMPSPIVTSGGPVRIAGRIGPGGPEEALVRVTTSLGAQTEARVRAKEGRFSCLYPGDFRGAPPLAP